MNISHNFAYNLINQRGFSGNREKELPKSENTTVAIYHINDVHGQVPQMCRLVTSAKQYDRFIASQSGKVDSMKVTSGDILLGYNDKINETAVAFLDIINPNASAIGNHEYDVSVNKFCEKTNNHKTRFLAANIKVPKDSKLKEVAVKSTIQNINGHTYGIIGIQPPDLEKHLKDKSQLNGIEIADIDRTIESVQKEINALELKGVNKIILLSHSGYDVEKEIAKRTCGLDVILGGHSHDIVEGLRKNENLFYNSNNEPVIISQAGRDGNNYGVLFLEFDGNGKIVKAKNSIYDTKVHKQDKKFLEISNEILHDNPRVIGSVSKAPELGEKILIEENPYASFIADAMISELDGDIALINSANLRGHVYEGPIDTRDIKSVVPFDNKLLKVKMNEKELVETLNHFGKSITRQNNRPGILQVGGLEYGLNGDGELMFLKIKQKTGNPIQVDIEDPSENRIYTVLYDDYLAQSSESAEVMHKLGTDDLIEYYDFDKDIPTIQYIEKMEGKPIEIEKDGRIVIEKAD